MADDQKRDQKRYRVRDKTNATKQTARSARSDSLTAKQAFITRYPGAVPLPEGADDSLPEGAEIHWNELTCMRNPEDWTAYDKQLLLDLCRQLWRFNYLSKLYVHVCEYGELPHDLDVGEFDRAANINVINAGINLLMKEFRETIIKLGRELRLDAYNYLPSPRNRAASESAGRQTAAAVNTDDDGLIA